MTESARVTDKALHYYARFDEKLRERLRALITDELIAEHKENPLGFRGHHSPDLQFVLNYFRRSPQAGKYIIVASVPWQLQSSIGAEERMGAMLSDDAPGDVRKGLAETAPGPPSPPPSP